MTQRVCHVFRVRDPDRFAAEHASIWPEIDALLRSAGFTQYDIFLHGDLVISFMEVDDYEAAAAAWNADPDAARWDDHWGDMLIIDEQDEQWPPPLRHVWSLP